MEIRLNPAWVWTCPSCDTENWREAESVEREDETDSEILIIPGFVECEYCGRKFDVIMPEGGYEVT